MQCTLWTPPFPLSLRALVLNKHIERLLCFSQVRSFRLVSQFPFFTPPTPLSKDGEPFGVANVQVMPTPCQRSLLITQQVPLGATEQHETQRLTTGNHLISVSIQAPKRRKEASLPLSACRDEKLHRESAYNQWSPTAPFGLDGAVHDLWNECGFDDLHQTATTYPLHTPSDQNTFLQGTNLNFPSLMRTFQVAQATWDMLSHWDE